MPEDVIDVLVRQIIAAAPGLPEARVREIAVAIRKDFGGQKCYVKKAPAEGKVLGLGAAIAAGVPLREAFEEVGVSRRHGYRVLGRRWTVRG